MANEDYRIRYVVWDSYSLKSRSNELVEPFSLEYFTYTVLYCGLKAHPLDHKHKYRLINPIPSSQYNPNHQLNDTHALLKSKGAFHQTTPLHSTRR